MSYSSRSIDASQLRETDLYELLKKYLLPADQMRRHGYPQPDPNQQGRCYPLDQFGKRTYSSLQPTSSYKCRRCETYYRVDSDGTPDNGRCTYHPARASRDLKWYHPCCMRYQRTIGCSTADYHVNEGENEASKFVGFVETKPKPERDPNQHGIFALDTELSFTTKGLELTQVIVINHKCEVIYETYVKPKNRLIDYNTYFSGIKKGDLDHVTTDIDEVQNKLLELFSSDSILIGHGLGHDLLSLKLFHKNVIDTAQLYPHPRGRPYRMGLSKLVEDHLGLKIQQAGKMGHDAREDAVAAALQLVLHKLEQEYR